jgi:hypothetical protein
MNQDAENLHLLGIFHYVVAGMAGLFSLFPLIHLFVGIGMTTVGLLEPKDTFPIVFVGLFFIALASCLILCGLTFSTCLAIAGRCLQRRKHYTYCLVMAGLACMFMPFGTVLGVFTIIVLVKEDVKGMFDGAASKDGTEVRV